ncbi:LysE family translocator [Dinoroseobacter sp. S76]|uniref:LysE family translocator n=1 Tax=Dinoroseobacter sp. S76 TaxID=3415124 RepID=UPI003C7DA956
MPDQLQALITFALVATASPGGATTLATASGARFGYRRSLPLILGIAGTLACLVALSGTSLAAVLLAMPGLDTAAKGIGSIYLLWLAMRIAGAGGPSSEDPKGARPLGAVGAGALLLVNPKAWAMALGVASSFSELTPDPLRLGSLLAAVFLASACLSLSLWAMAGRLLAQRLSRPVHWRLFNGAMAVLLAGAVIQLWL